MSQGYRLQVLADGPSLYMPLDVLPSYASGAAVPDVSDSRMAPTLSGVGVGNATRTRPVRGDTAPGFATNVAASYISVPDNALLRPASITVEAWVHFDGNTNGDRGLVVKSTSGALSDGYGLYVLSSGVVEFYVNNYNGAGRTDFVGFGDRDLAAWQHLVGTYVPGPSFGTVEGWWQGRRVAVNTTAPASLSHSTTDMRVGDYVGSPSPFNGMFAHVAVYPRILTPTEIVRHWQRGRGMLGPRGLVSLRHRG